MLTAVLEGTMEGKRRRGSKRLTLIGEAKRGGCKRKLRKGLDGSSGDREQEQEWPQTMCDDDDDDDV